MFVLQDKYGMWANAFNQGLLQGLQDAYKRKLMEYQNQLAEERAKQAFNIWKQQRDYLLQQEEQKRQQLLNHILGQQVDVPQLTEPKSEPLSRQFDVSFTQPKTLTETLAKNVSLTGQPQQLFSDLKLGDVTTKREYVGGLLSDLVNKNPMLADMIKAEVYGIQIPYVRPKVAGFKVLDTGEKLIPTVIMSDGRVIIPGEFVKSLSPKDREWLKTKRKELGVKIQMLKNKEALNAFNTWYKQQMLNLNKQRVKAEQERVNILKQKTQRTNAKQPTPDTLWQKAVRLVKTKYGIEPVKDITGEIVIKNLYTGETLDPQTYQQMVEQAYREITGQEPPKQPQQPIQTPQSVERFLSNWGIK
jgi:hypothetical protein